MTDELPEVVAYKKFTADLDYPVDDGVEAVVPAHLADAAIAALEALNTDLCEREILLRAVLGAETKRAEAAEADVERLRWMLNEAADQLAAGMTEHSPFDCTQAEMLSDLESRWTAREEAGDEHR
jgi:hypothetical protein